MATPLIPPRDCNLSTEQLQAILDGIAARRNFGFDNANIKWRLRWSGFGKIWVEELDPNIMNTIPGFSIESDQAVATELTEALNSLRKRIANSPAGKRAIALGNTTIQDIHIQVYKEAKSAANMVGGCGTINYPVNPPNPDTARPTR